MTRLAAGWTCWADLHKTPTQRDAEPGEQVNDRPLGRAVEPGDGRPSISGSGRDGDPRVEPEPTPAELLKVVALDGPAGTGKSSVAKGVAAVLGWRFVDTGASYRAVTLALLRAGVDLADPVEVARAAAKLHVELLTDPSSPGVRVDGADVSQQIRSEEVSAHVSAVSAVPAVREQLVSLQRRSMGTAGAVVEGRDIATVVAPRARLKVYLDARPEVRARRRAREGESASGSEGTSVRSSEGSSADSSEALTTVAAQLRERDTRDNETTRLAASDGALHVDTSDLDLPAVIDLVVCLAQEAGLTSDA